MASQSSDPLPLLLGPLQCLHQAICAQTANCLLMLISTEGLRFSPAHKSFPGDSARGGTEAQDITLSRHSGKGVSFWWSRGGKVPEQLVASSASCTEGFSHAM